MIVRNQSWLVRLFVAVGCLFLATPARAQMIPLDDGREIRASCNWNAFAADEFLAPAGFFAAFEEYLDPFVEYSPPPDPPVPSGSASAFAFQSSQFNPAGIFYAGTSSGQWQGDPLGGYGAYSLAHLKVRMPTCVEYNFYAQIDPGDTPDGILNGFVDVRCDPVTFIHVEGGESTMTGRLGPGDYVFQAKSSVGGTLPFLQGATYSMIWTCVPCQNPLISSQPADVSQASGLTASFSITPSGPVGSFTYQWRFNGDPLVDGPDVAGATTPSLSLFNATQPDTGYYDVIVSDGAVTEPSRLARLEITSPIGVDDVVVAMDGFSLGVATPNPFISSTTCRFDAPKPIHASVVVFDASGRVVRKLAEKILTGSGSLTWDGRTSSGSLASPGVYFLRVSDGRREQVRRIALVR